MNDDKWLWRNRSSSSWSKSNLVSRLSHECRPCNCDSYRDSRTGKKWTFTHVQGHSRMIHYLQLLFPVRRSQVRIFFHRPRDSRLSLPPSQASDGSCNLQTRHPPLKCASHHSPESAPVVTKQEFVTKPST